MLSQQSMAAILLPTHRTSSEVLLQAAGAGLLSCHQYQLRVVHILVLNGQSFVLQREKNVNFISNYHKNNKGVCEKLTKWILKEI